MASTLTRKKSHRKRAPRIGNMTRDELRLMIKKEIVRTLKVSGSGRIRRTNRKVTPEMRRRAIEAAGKFRAGRADVSSKHDEYLAADMYGS